VGPTDSLPELVDTLLAPALQHRAGRVVFVGYSDDPLLSARVGAALRRGFAAAGIAVVDVLRAHRGAWCRVPAHPGRREAPMTPYDETSHPFAARAVFEGRVTHASREALRETVATSAEAAARVAERQAHSRPAGPEDVAWVRDLVARCVRTGRRPDDAEAARALSAVVRFDVRDAALRAVTRQAADAHLQLWAGLLRRAPTAQVPEAAALTAFCAWQAGNGALAWCALDRCLELEPGHRLGLCLAECLTRAVPPSAFEEVGGRTTAAGPPTRDRSDDW
jgi:hypothetical protein